MTGFCGKIKTLVYWHPSLVLFSFVCCAWLGFGSMIYPLLSQDNNDQGLQSKKELCFKKSKLL